MSGFDAAKVEAEFFAGTRIRANFLVNLGRGDAASLFRARRGCPSRMPAASNDPATRNGLP